MEKTLFAALLLLSLFVLAACSASDDDDDSSGGPADDTVADDDADDVASDDTHWDDDAADDIADDSAADDTASDDAADDTSPDDTVADDTVADDTSDDDTTVEPPLPGRYVIVVSDATESAVWPISDLRASQGYQVETVNLNDLAIGREDEPIQDVIRGYLIDTYEPPEQEEMPYLLLAGGYNTIPVPLLSPDPQYPEDYEVASDDYYADVDVVWNLDGDQYVGEWGQDVFTHKVEYLAGRIPSDDPDLVEDYALKTVAFEQDADSEYKWDTLLLAGYIEFPGDSALIINILKNTVFVPNGFGVRTLFETGGPMPGDGVLTRDSLIADWGANPYGLVMWASHGSSDGTFFIDSADAPLFGAGQTSMVWSSACSQMKPTNPDNIAASLLLHGPAAGFVGSTAITHPGDLGEGSLIFVVMADRYMVQNHSLAYAVYESEQMYLQDYWILPYDRGLLLRNYYGFSVLGDPAQSYWPR